MKKTIIIAIVAVAVIAIVAFFYPKNAGGTCGFCQPPPAVQRTEYGCLGFKQEIRPGLGCADCGIEIVCYGIVASGKKCYTYMDGFENLPTEVLCEY